MAATHVTNSRGEVVQLKSPAEFFAENQNIAGFDNVRRRAAARFVHCVTARSHSKRFAFAPLPPCLNARSPASPCTRPSGSW